MSLILTGYCYEKEMKKVDYKLLKEKYKKRQIKDENLRDREQILDYVFDIKSKEGEAQGYT